MSPAVLCTQRAKTPSRFSRWATRKITLIIPTPNVCRRPAIGISTSCSSGCSAAETAKELAGHWFKSGVEAFHATFGSEEADLVNAPKVLNARGEGSESTTEQRKAAL